MYIALTDLLLKAGHRPATPRSLVYAEFRNHISPPFYCLSASLVDDDLLIVGLLAGARSINDTTVKLWSEIEAEGYRRHAEFETSQAQHVLKTLEAAPR